MRLDWRPLDWTPASLRQDWAELDVDEEMASLDAVRAPIDAAAGSGGGVGWLIILGLAVLAVVGMLMILIGQRRRLARDEPRGLDGFSVGDDYEGYEGYEGHEGFDDLATVEIEEPGERIPFDERVAAVVAADRNENVVPIRKRNEDHETYEAERRAEATPSAVGRSGEAPAYDGYQDEAFRDEEPERARYAFAAGGGAQMSADAPSSPLAMRTGAGTGSGASTGAGMGGTQRDAARGEYGGRAYEGGFSSGGQDDDAPFVAPFIREDIERAERRQADRIDGLRDEVHRQFQTMKNENAARLDLFVSTVDRKLTNLRASEGASEAAVQHAMDAALRPVFDRLDGIVSHVATQERRLADLATLLERRLPDLMNTSADIRSLADEVQEVRADLGLTAERMSDRVGEIGGGLDGLRETIERLERALLDRATAEGAANVALTEVVRGTLPEGTYEFGLRLANGNTADCVISFEGSRERVAIDAGFPMEAFGQLPSRDAVSKNMPQAKAAEDVFRRAILRAILEAADRCIVPGDTTDSCLLFLPSEAAYTVLHDRFGDLVRDAQRARVWLTSPSTLMGTLNLLRNLMPEARTALPTEAGTKAEARDQAEPRRSQHQARPRTQAKASADREHAEPPRDHAGHHAREQARDHAQRAARAKEQAQHRAEGERRAEADRRDKERAAMRAEIRSLRERAASLAGELDRTRGTLSDLIETTDRLGGQDRDEAPRRQGQDQNQTHRPDARGGDLIDDDAPRTGRYDDEGAPLVSLDDWSKDAWSEDWSEDDRDDPFEDE